MPSIKSCLLALVLCVGALAVDAGAQPVSESPVVAPPVPMLWKVSDDDNALYLLGSFHLLKPGDYPLSPDVQMALDDAEEVVFELSPEELTSPALGLQMAQAAARTDGTTLDSQIGPELAEKLEQWAQDNAAHLDRTGLTHDVLQMFRPWFAGLMVSVVELTKQGLDPALGLDRHFMTQAAEAGKETAALETGADQIAVFAGMSEREQLQMLAESLDQAAAGPAQIDRMHRQWRTGDAEGLWSGMGTQLRRDYPQLYRRINVERNDAWVPQLVERLESGEHDALVVVGALHLLGEDGVVEKLRARGYRVERICTACAAANDGAAPAASASPRGSAGSGGSAAGAKSDASGSPATVFLWKGFQAPITPGATSNEGCYARVVVGPVTADSSKRLHEAKRAAASAERQFLAACRALGALVPGDFADEWYMDDRADSSYAAMRGNRWMHEVSAD
jgi:uncharacterized protein